MTEVDCPEVALCNWQDVKVQLLTNELFVCNRIALIDLGIAMVNYADESRLRRLYKLAEENVKVGSVHAPVSYQRCCFKSLLTEVKKKYTSLCCDQQKSGQSSVTNEFCVTKMLTEDYLTWGFWFAVKARSFKLPVKDNGPFSRSNMCR